MIDFSIIVVSYNSARYLPRLVESLDAAVSGATWHLTVVNNSAENLHEIIGGGEHTSVIDAGANLGYSGGLNLGLAHAPKASWVVFLNPDVILRPGALDRLRTVSPEVSATVPRLVDERGVRQDSLRREPSLLRALGEAAFGDRWPARPPLLSETVRGAQHYEHEHSIDWATGAVLVVRASIADTVGKWDAERFFMYSEETDYARRIRALDGSILYIPEAVVEHSAGGSGSSPMLDALLELNKVRYFQKWHGSVATALFAMITFLRNLLRPHRSGARAAVRALLSGRARRALPGGR